MASQRTYDVVLVGAGHNALVAAVYLLRAGRSVCLLERAPTPGGWVRSEELTLPGFVHDTFSALHPILVNGPVFAELGEDLAALGLRYVQGDIATGASLPDGRTAIIPTDPDPLARELDRLGEREAWTGLQTDLAPYLESLFALLGMDLASREATALIGQLDRDSADSALPFKELLTGSGWDLIHERFHTEELRSVLLPWLLHVGLSPHDAGGAMWAAVLVNILGAGNPAPVGGSGKLTEALVALVTRLGGEIRTSTEAEHILLDSDGAAGVGTQDGERFMARQAVIASTTPDQLYGRLLRDAPGIPAGVRAQAARYRYRRGCFQLNLALSGKPRFTDPRLGLGGGINLGHGADELSTSVRQAEDGFLPARPSISWHEPTAVDDGRAPAGRAVARLQVMDAPIHPRGDAAGVIAAGGAWTRSMAEHFADRMIEEAALHIPGLDRLVLGRHVLTPGDLAASNPNAGPGDHAGGHNGLVQGFTQRPIPAHRGGYATAVPRLYLIGAASWPGPGVSGASGRAVALTLLA
ncbi:NAD(P)/FAD-dependent oxidoreductase [Streptomyces sp. HNM0575]|uniref:phytoene desaturase family protein n=1 Tax=Streptomyces sp. HNM0575 TaxID=2716338 RepID=UPI00145C6F6C|nr:NAD(P)/FAD-dependent oxidoreductase [Streptomyces sp. HNM0575]NLU76251.1 NAD(P)/FAD-dependent oxidoreductase [Streptomyces sp. HNM0575]